MEYGIGFHSDYKPDLLTRPFSKLLVMIIGLIEYKKTILRKVKVVKKLAIMHFSSFNSHIFYNTTEGIHHEMNFYTALFS